MQRGSEGQFAYVVNANAEATVQPIRVAQMQDGKAVIADGLAAGTRVVVDGQYKIKPGTKVVEAKPAATSPAAAPKSGNP